MNAKQLYDKHLKLITPKHWIGEKQLMHLKYEASLNAINEALNLNKLK